jgi:N-dimethylarginine dimethylaminohydrolase
VHYTSHSEIGKIKSLFVKDVQHAFVNEQHIEKHWAALNYLDKPDFNSALLEYDLFLTQLKKEGAEIFYLPEEESVNMDSVYCRDASVATNGGMIISNMGKPARANEPKAEKRAFELNGIKILGSITAPGTVEGGDVVWLDENTLAVGHTYRTNQEGISQLTALLKPLGVQVIVVPLPHSDVHFESGG